MNANQKIFVGCIAALILCLAVVGKHFFPDLDTGAVVALCVGTLTGLGVTHLNADAPAAGSNAAAPGNGQGGFASIRLLTIVALLAIVAACTTGCAGFGVFQQALIGYEGAAYSGLKQINDNKLNVTTAALCEGTSIGAALRNPASIAVLKAACTSAATDPNSIFDGKQQQPITINLQMPAAAASAAK